MRPGLRLRSVVLYLALAVCLWPPARREAPAQPPGAAYFVSLDGDDANSGATTQPWRHIEWAMTRPFLRPGDTIFVRGGVYRPFSEASPSPASTTDDALIRPVASGDPSRPITVMAQPGETVILSGRFLVATWQPLDASSTIYYYDYSTPVAFPFDHPFQVVQDGRLLFRVSTLDNLDRPGRCYVDIALQRIYVWTTDSAPPASHRMEYGASVTGIEFLGGAHGWRLSGLSLAGFRTAGIVIRDGAGSIELDHLDISYTGAHRPGADPTSGYALVVYDTAGGNYVHDCTLHHTEAEALHISQSGSGSGLYENNDIHDAGGPDWFQEGYHGEFPIGPGVILRGSRVTLRGNHIHSNGYHGLILESDLRGSEGAAAPSQNIIEGNVFFTNGGDGLYADGKNGATPSRSNVIRFNLFERNNQTRGGNAGAELHLAGNFTDTLIYNNTFYAETAHCMLLAALTAASGAAQGADAVPDGLRLANNVAVLASRAPYFYPLRVSGIGPDFSADSDDWFRPLGGVPISWNTIDFVSLDQFRSATGQERRGLSLDPRFVSSASGDFRLRVISPLIGRGVVDIRGNGAVLASSPAGGPPDLGALPYRPLLGIAPAELRFAVAAGHRDPPSQRIAIQNGGESPLSWAAHTTGQNWLRLSAASGATPAALDVSAHTAGLAPGTYSAAIQITPSLDGEPPTLVRVTLVVSPAPPRAR